MKITLKEALKLLAKLRSSGINPILYGSLGVSTYLGSFKKFNDIDLLIEDEWIDDNWQQLQEIMRAEGFKLIDEREHEFRDNSGLQVAFAKQEVLYRDGVVTDPKNDIVVINNGAGSYTTLTPEAFLRAYKFSEKDGYRRDVRGKKDRRIIELLENEITRTDN